MLISTFRSGYIINIILFFCVSVLLWLDAFIRPPAMIVENNFGLIYQNFNFLASLPPHVSVLIAFLLLMGEAILLNSIVADNPVFSKSTFLPALVYVILMSYLPRQLTIHPILVANFFLILSLKNITQCYRKTNAFKESFNASFWIAVASMIHFPLVLMIVFVWMAFIIYRISTWREWVISFIGFLTPYFLLLSYYFLTDGLRNFATFFMEQWNRFTKITISLSNELFLFWLLFGLIIGVSFFKMMTMRGEKLIIIRNTFTVLIVMFFSCLAIVLSSGSDPINLLHLLFPPSAIIITYYFIETRKLFFPELFFSLLLIIIAVNKFI
ncbi:MAG: hypothetical protein U1C46_02710 [Bacteroidales bacterium]|nr:hypothetical protein [Bacteroidales bacterium]